ncbi:MAG: hypothetical protein JSS49_08365 [Planctomycetes bacterium]|nr:hypothetical protein [Planctomycetota bacterium]
MLGFKSVAVSGTPHSAPLLQLSMEMIGRPATGKTVALTAINEVCEGSHLPSGLYFGVSDPLKSNEILRQLRRRTEELQGDAGLPSTQDDYVLEYDLEEGDETRVRFQTHEMIGQVLTGTDSDSPPAQRQLYDRYCGRLASAHVLVPMIAVPPASDNVDGLRQYKEDLRLTSAYLRQAIKMHTSDKPCAVAIGMTQLDAMFPSEQRARETLTDDVLRESLAPLVQAVSMMSKVREAAIIPTSGFGFGRAEAIGRNTGDRNPRGTLHRLVSDDIEPFNIVGLLTWVLLHGLLPQDVPHASQEATIGRLVNLLADDLDAISPWIVPIKHRGAVV